MTHTIRSLAVPPLAAGAEADRALLDGFLQADRRGPNRPLVAINSRLLIANAQAGDLSGGVPDQHATLWAQVRRALTGGATIFTLASNGDKSPPVVASVRQLHTAHGALVGALVRLRVDSEPEAEEGGRVRSSSRERQVLAQLPGRSHTWTEAVARSARLVGDNCRILLVGPVGVGKSALARAVLGLPLVGESGDVSDADAPVAGFARPRTHAGETESGNHSMLTAHLERLDDTALEALCRELDQHTSDHPILATYRTGPGAPVPAMLLARFEHVIELPALDARREDVPDIVAAALDDGAGLPVQVEPDALSELMNRDWPGNVRQLRRVVSAARGSHYNRLIRKVDLPDPSRPNPPTRRLTRLELAERDTIAAVLVAAGGNKRAAAAQLDVSRSTLYRKLSALGLDA